MMLRLFLVALLVYLTAAACPNGYTQILNGDCFKLYKDTSYYADTIEHVCRADGGHLASIHSEEEHRSLVPLYGEHSPWIGLQCTYNDISTCSWADNSTVDYTAFQQPGVPGVMSGCYQLIPTDLYFHSVLCWSVPIDFLCRVPIDNGGCPSDQTPYNGGCAAVKTHPRVWSEAEADCVAHGSHLASIHNNDDDMFFQYLATRFAPSSNFYIGLNHTGGITQWSWTDSSKYDYKRWAVHYPDILFGYCAQLLLTTEFGAIGQWSNIPCDTTLPYMCFRNERSTPTLAPMTCSGTEYLYDEGVIYSPGFPVSIPSASSCEYIIAVGAKKLVSVTFPSFETDIGTTVAIYDGMGAAQPMAVISGSVSATKEFKTSQNVMKLVFTTSLNPTGAGWQADYKSVGGDVTTPAPTISPVGCGKVDLVADTYIYSPNWPNAYPSTIGCTYHVRSGNGRTLKFDFSFLDISSCCSSVSVYDGPDTTSKLITTQTGQSGSNVKIFYSTGSSLTFTFVADNDSNGRGWMASVYNN